MMQGTDQFGGSEAEMHKVTETAAIAFPILILATTCFTKIGDWRQLRVQWAAL